MTRLGLILAVAALAGAAGAQALRPALALEAQFDRASLPRNEHAAANARCEPGTRVVSGGFAAPDHVYAGGGPYTDILGAARKGEREFVVRAQNFSMTKGTLYSYAYCADLGPIEVASASITIEDRRDGVATARCPGDLTAISGGWAGESVKRGRPRMIPFLSKRAGTDGWTVGAENGAFSGSAKLIVYAHCAELAPARVEVNDLPLPELSPTSAGVSCDPGEQAIAGGFDAATPRGFSVGASVFTSRRKKAGGRWKVALDNGGRARHLRVYAYCL